MKNHSFFSGLMLALCFVFLATTAQAQYVQTLYKVTSGLLIDGTKVTKITEASGPHISIYESAESKMNIGIVLNLGNVGYNYATWRKHGSYIAGPVLNLSYSTKEWRAKEFEATWKYVEDNNPYDPSFSQIYIGQTDPAVEIFLIVYDEQGKEMIMYNAKAVFFGRID